jgi:hypothetical protein
MEFDNNAPVTDDQRRLAESKKLTLQPVHSDVEPDAPADAEIAARHLNEPAIANVETDTEQNVAAVQPSSGLLADTKDEKHSNGSTVAYVSIAALSAIGITLFFFLG